jgi:predicted Zn-dependent peptidase
MEDRYTNSDRSGNRDAWWSTERGMPAIPRRHRACGALLLVLAVLVAYSSRATSGERVVERLPGGPEVIFERHPESEVACLTVAVRSGSAFEAPDTRGISHFLEHMVFDGSELYSRTDISDWIDDRGAFLNAFTRKETAVYFLLVPYPFLEQGTEILSQMLLHSVFSPDEFEKERKVVLEEIRKTMDDPSSERTRFVDRYLYRGSLLAEPILGYPAAIERMSREDVVRFYREHYRPGAMRIYLTGNFEIERARGWISDFFFEGGRKGMDAGVLSEEIDVEPRWSNEIAVRSGDGLEPGFDILIPLPVPGEQGFPAALLLSSMIQGERSPLPGIFASLSLPEPDASFEVHARFSGLRIHAAGGGADESYMRVPDALHALAGWKPSSEDIEAARTAFLSSELFDREKYHFYIMLNGERLALFGERYLIAALDGLSKVDEKEFRRFLRAHFSRTRFNACLVRSDSAASLAPAMGRLSSERDPDRIAAFVGGRSPRVQTLANGCRVISRRRSNSNVAALHVLVAGRTCIQGGAMEGMAVLLHTLFESSAAGKDCARELEGFGARIQWQDNPYIPFDDYYLNPSFSFIRLEAPAEKIERAAEFLIDLLVGAEFSDEDLSAAKAAMDGELRVRSGSATAALDAAVFAELFSGHPYGSPIFPRPQRLAAVGLDELSAFRERYVKGGNLTAALVSPLPTIESERLMQRLFSGLPSGDFGRCPPIPAPPAYHEVSDSIRKEGAYIAVGWLQPEGPPKEIAAFLVAAEVLSRRMQLELREKQGLTYSTGCDVTLLPGGGIAIATIGTRAENLGTAENALKREIERFAEDPPAPAEIETAIRRLLGRWSRSELSSINEAYIACRDLFVTGESVPVRLLVERVTAPDAAAAARGALSMNRAVLVRLVPKGGEGPQTMPPAMRMKMR